MSIFRLDRVITLFFMKFHIKTFILKTNKLNRALTLQNNKKKIS